MRPVSVNGTCSVIGEPSPMGGTTNGTLRRSTKLPVKGAQLHGLPLIGEKAYEIVPQICGVPDDRRARGVGRARPIDAADGFETDGHRKLLPRRRQDRKERERAIRPPGGKLDGDRIGGRRTREQGETESG